MTLASAARAGSPGSERELGVRPGSSRGRVIVGGRKSELGARAGSWEPGLPAWILLARVIQAGSDDSRQWLESSKGGQVTLASEIHGMRMDMMRM